MRGWQNLQLQLIDSHFIIYSLKLLIKFQFLISNGTMPHTFESKHSLFYGGTSNICILYYNAFILTY